MHPDGMGWIWVPSGLKGRALPAHYEPLESNVRNPMYRQQTNPMALRLERDDNRYAASPDERYPYADDVPLTDITLRGDVANIDASRRAAARAVRVRSRLTGE